MNVGVDAKEAKCGNCAHGEKVLIKDEDHGFLLCEFMKSWEWIAARMPCSFNPTKWGKN